MKSTIRNLILVGIAFVLAAGCGHEDAAQSGKLQVAASIFPLADVARQIGGDNVEVVTLLPPGASPHGFEPQPRQVEQLARCRLLLTIGADADPWAARVARASGANIKTLPFAGVAGQSDVGNGDPHGWLDPVRMKTFTEAVAEAMAQLDPAHADAYAARAKVFIAELDKLDAEHRDTLGKLKSKAFASFHPAFTHLAARYGLKQAALADPHADEGGPEQLEHVVEFVRSHKLKVVFAEPQFPAEKLQWIQEQTGVSVGRLDPIGNPDATGYDTYLAMMRSNLRTLAAAMSE